MYIEDIRNINKLSAELLVRLYALLETEKIREEKELIQDFIGDLDLYLREFCQFEAEKTIEFEIREREHWSKKIGHLELIESFTPKKN